MNFGTFCGNRLVNIRVYPIDYNTKTDEITLYRKIHLELLYRTGSKVTPNQRIRYRQSSKVINKYLRASVDNKKDINIYKSNPPAICESRIIDENTG